MLGGTGYLKEFLYQMVIKLTNPKYWVPFFKLMDIFDCKSYGLGFEIYQYVKSTARVNSRIYEVLYCCLKESPSLTIMSWSIVHKWFCLFFNVDNNNNSRTHSYNKKSNVKAEYFKVLGISTNSTKQEIKNAYRKLIIVHHPDKGGDAKQFIRIQEAYNYLINN